jgi:hypothetical protein
VVKESEPTGADAIEERAAFKHSDQEIDVLTGQAAQVLRAGLPPDLEFVLVVAKTRQHYMHTCVASGATPHQTLLILHAALNDLKDQAYLT